MALILNVHVIENYDKLHEKQKCLQKFVFRQVIVYTKLVIVLVLNYKLALHKVVNSPYVYFTPFSFNWPKITNFLSCLTSECKGLHKLTMIKSTYIVMGKIHENSFGWCLKLSLIHITTQMIEIFQEIFFKWPTLWCKIFIWDFLNMGITEN